MNGWLARIRLEKDDLGAAYRDSYAWHKSLWDCFPGIPDGQRGFLTRVEHLRKSCLIHIVSRRMPERPAWCPPHSWHVKGIPSSFLMHDIYHFDLIANPTRRRCLRDESGRCIDRGKRVAIRGDAARMDWLHRQGEQHGFALIAAPVVSDLGLTVFTRHGVRGEHATARFRGALRVTDREAFVEAFYSGIGSAKAFHHGLLMLSPSQQ